MNADNNSEVLKNHKPGEGNAILTQEEKKQNTKQIAIYLLITFVVTYGIEIFMIMPMVGSTDVDQAYAAQALISSVMFIPAFSALLTRLLTKERLMGSNLMLTLNLKGNKKYYGLVWFGFALLVILGTALYFFIFPKQYDGNMGYLQMLLDRQAQAGGHYLRADEADNAGADWHGNLFVSLYEYYKLLWGRVGMEGVFAAPDVKAVPGSPHITFVRADLGTVACAPYGDGA